MMRRIRSNEGIRRMFQETRLSPDDMVLPLFFHDTDDGIRDIASMPGVPVYPLLGCGEVVSDAEEHGIGAVLLFGVPGSKDAVGSGSYAENGVSQTAIRKIKQMSDITVIADLCMCGYTDHGHCGILKDGKVDNDTTLGIYGKIAESLAVAGADMVAPSGMMDLQVSAIRDALDSSGNKGTMIMSYSAKYHSSFYGPFRDVARSSPANGDRSTYQMQCGNRREAMREILKDVEEGADAVMVKPAMAYLDVIREARTRTDVPIAAYHVSGEYAMVMAAAERGWINGHEAMMESLMSMKRAGADKLITYYAKEAASALGGRR